MTEDERIIEMLFERSEQGIRELDIKYGKICRDLSYRIVAAGRMRRNASMTLIWAHGTPFRRSGRIRF